MNFGTSTIIAVKQNTVNFNQNAWITFDISGYSGISSADLALHMISVGNEMPPSDVPVSVYYAPSGSDSWSETGLTWNTAPSPGNTPSGSIATVTIPSTVTAGQDFTWNVASAVVGDNDGASTFVLSAWAGGNTNHGLNFGSREGGHPPLLQIKYGKWAANAMISTATFGGDFVVTLRVSDNPSLGTGALTAH